MKEFAEKCCGSCKAFNDDHMDINFCVKLKGNMTEINVNDFLCDGKYYKPRNPIKNYEDDLQKENKELRAKMNENGAVALQLKADKVKLKKIALVYLESFRMSERVLRRLSEIDNLYESLEILNKECESMSQQIEAI